MVKVMINPIQGEIFLELEKNEGGGGSWSLPLQNPKFLAENDVWYL